jgi:lactoylglutathione lyase
MSLSSLITGIAHIGIRVHDLARSRSFYELLGFQFVTGPVGPEPVAILAHPSGITINFILNAAEAAAPNVLMDVAEKHPGYTHRPDPLGKRGDHPHRRTHAVSWRRYVHLHQRP